MARQRHPGVTRRGEVNLLPTKAMRDTTTMIAASAPREICTLPSLVPDAPAMLPSVPGPELALPAAGSGPPP